jgi:hypothetical protein
MAGTADLGLYAEYLFQSGVSTDNAAVTITLGATANTRHVVRSVHVSYEAAASAADHLVTIAWTQRGLAKGLTMAIAAGEASPTYVFDFPEGYIIGDTNTAITIELDAGGVGNIGHINVWYR